MTNPASKLKMKKPRHKNAINPGSEEKTTIATPSSRKNKIKPFAGREKVFHRATSVLQKMYSLFFIHFIVEQIPALASIKYGMYHRHEAPITKQRVK
jgi:hypothetical protein